MYRRHELLKIDAAERAKMVEFYIKDLKMYVHTRQLGGKQSINTLKNVVVNMLIG